MLSFVFQIEALNSYWFEQEIDIIKKISKNWDIGIFLVKYWNYLVNKIIMCNVYKCLMILKNRYQELYFFMCCQSINYRYINYFDGKW